MSAREAVHPKVSGLVGGVGDDHPVALRRELAGIAGEAVESVRQVELFRPVGRAVREIGINQRVFVHDVAVVLAVGRKTPA